MAENESKLQLIPLGGLGEVGKNMILVRYGNNIIILDCGLIFPEDDLLGVDVVIPDISYLLENRSIVRGIFLSHGHEDHIGALPYVLKDINVPVYGTKLTLGLVQGKLKENNLNNVKLHSVQPRDVIKMGPFRVEFIRISHSISDAVAIAVHSPLGTIVYTGDFKFDHTPPYGEVADFSKLAQLGEDGILALMSDSTNAERPGYTMSEQVVSRAFDEVFHSTSGRIIVASFASNIQRVQQAIKTADRYGRKVAVVGRSMVNIVNLASDLGYLEIPTGVLFDIDEVISLPRSEQVIITTGSQGEPMAGLTRMAMSDHRQVEIGPGDTIIISATPIPGNEKTVGRTINHLMRQGAEVIHEAYLGIHVSGHASQEDLKMMLNLIKPRYFIPVHGEYRMLISHAKLAEAVGIGPERIFILENGQSIEFNKTRAFLGQRVTAGRVLVDGLGVGDVGNIVLRDRKELSQEGILIVVVTLNKQSNTILAGPDIVSRGFVYVRESETLLDEARERVRQLLENCTKNGITEWTVIKGNVRDNLRKFLYERTGRTPMITPILMEV